MSSIRWVFAGMSEAHPDPVLPTVKSAVVHLFNTLSAAATPLTSVGPLVTGLPPALQAHAASIFALRATSAVVAAITSPVVPPSSARPISGNDPSKQATAPTSTILQLISAAIDTSLGRHLNVMLRPQMAAQLRTTAASLSIAAKEAANDRAEPDFALPFLGESLLAALDLSGTSPPSGSMELLTLQSGVPMQSRPIQPVAGSVPGLVPFMAFGGDIGDSGIPLESGNPGTGRLASDSPNRGASGGQIQESWNSREQEVSNKFPNQSELQPFTGVAALARVC